MQASKSFKCETKLILSENKDFLIQNIAFLDRWLVAYEKVPKGLKMKKNNQTLSNDWPTGIQEN
jgi:hypothetical protein